MELYAAVRRSVYVEGWSERAAARRFGLARETVRKMLRYRLPPGYRRAASRSGVRSWRPSRGSSIRSSVTISHRPKKQRHTAKRICERLRAEHGFTGGYTIVKAYVREQKLGGQEMFVPLAHPPGDAQADFGEALVVIDWRRTQGARPGRGSAAQRRRVREGLSGGDDGGVLRWAQRCVPLLRRRAASHRLRQHQAGGGADAR